MWLAVGIFTGGKMESKMEARILFGSCPLCGSNEIFKSVTGDCSKHPLYQAVLPSKIQWIDCGQCGHQFTDGYFTEDALKIIFSKTHDNQKVGHQLEDQRIVSASMVEKVIPFRSKGTWLDVGFGNGSLLFTAAEYGFEAIGVDLRAENVKTMKELGYQAYCSLVEEIDFEKMISVVSLMDVLEHIPRPKEVLRSLYSSMEQDGCLLISMPNTENIIWKLMCTQNANPYLGEIEHYHNFSRTRLFSLLKECGFEAVRYGVSTRYRACMEVIALKQ